MRLGLARRTELALAAAMALTLAPAASLAACVADSPLGTARWIFAQAYWFHTQRTAEAADYLSPALLRLMEKHWACRASGATCGIDGDPWTNAAAGGALDPVVFSLRTSPPERTRVAMRYVRDGEPGSAELILVRAPGEECWRLDDIVGGAGRSLRQSLEAHPHR